MKKKDVSSEEAPENSNPCSEMADLNLSRVWPGKHFGSEKETAYWEQMASTLENSNLISKLSDAKWGLGG